MYFILQAGIDLMSKGHMLADVVAIIGELNVAAYIILSYNIRSTL